MYKIEKLLNKIFKYYKKKHKLLTTFEVYQGGYYCLYSYVLDKIQLGLKHFEDKDLIKRLQKRSIYKFKDVREVFIWAILHELGHSLDYINNTQEFIYQINITNQTLYCDSNKYHDSRPFEIKADKFANQEIKNWI